MRTQPWPACVAGAVIFFASCAAQAQNNVVRIEEDWQLLVTQPDAPLDAPQVTTTMVPLLRTD